MSDKEINNDESNYMLETILYPPNSQFYLIEYYLTRCKLGDKILKSTS